MPVPCSQFSPFSRLGVIESETSVRLADQAPPWWSRGHSQTRRRSPKIYFHCCCHLVWSRARFHHSLNILMKVKLLATVRCGLQLIIGSRALHRQTVASSSIPASTDAYNPLDLISSFAHPPASRRRSYDEGSNKAI